MKTFAGLTICHLKWRHLQKLARWWQFQNIYIIIECNGRVKMFRPMMNVYSFTFKFSNIWMSLLVNARIERKWIIYRPLNFRHIFGRYKNYGPNL